jgi:hypothetical protein
MKYKHIYAAHEARMWVMTIINAVSTITTIAATHPELVESIKNRFSGRKRIRIIVVEEPK